MRLAGIAMKLSSMMVAAAVIAVVLGAGRAVQRRHALMKLAADCETAELRLLCESEYNALLASLYEAPPKSDVEIREIEERMHTSRTGCGLPTRAAFEDR